MNWINGHPQLKKISDTTFGFPEFAPTCKKSIHCIYSFLRYSQFSVARLDTIIFDHSHPKSFWSTNNLCEFVLTCKKSGYFISLFWRYGWLKNPAIWLADNILANISGRIYEICAGKQQIIQIFIVKQIQ